MHPPSAVMSRTQPRTGNLSSMVKRLVAANVVITTAASSASSPQPRSFLTTHSNVRAAIRAFVQQTSWLSWMSDDVLQISMTKKLKLNPIQWLRRRKKPEKHIDLCRLPPELRDNIYEQICTVYLKPQALPKPAKRGRRTYLAHTYRNDFINLQLVSHRFREEFVAFWTARYTFGLEPIQGALELPFREFQTFRRIQSRPFACEIWRSLRDFVVRVGPLISNHVRKVVVLCRYKVEGHQVSVVRLIKRLDGDEIARNLKRLSDVHQRLEFEVVVQLYTDYGFRGGSAPARCIHGLPIHAVAALTFRQNSE